MLARERENNKTWHVETFEIFCLRRELCLVLSLYIASVFDH